MNSEAVACLFISQLTIINRINFVIIPTKWLHVHKTIK